MVFPLSPVPDGSDGEIKITSGTFRVVDHQTFVEGEGRRSLRRMKNPDDPPVEVWRRRRGKQWSRVFDVVTRT